MVLVFMPFVRWQSFNGLFILANKMFERRIPDILEPKVRHQTSLQVYSIKRGCRQIFRALLL